MENVINEERGLSPGLSKFLFSAIELIWRHFVAALEARVCKGPNHMTIDFR